MVARANLPVLRSSDSPEAHNLGRPAHVTTLPLSRSRRRTAPASLAVSPAARPPDAAVEQALRTRMAPLFIEELTSRCSRAESSATADVTR
jgi:hypothetical protein